VDDEARICQEETGRIMKRQRMRRPLFLTDKGEDQISVSKRFYAGRMTFFVGLSDLNQLHRDSKSHVPREALHALLTVTHSSISTKSTLRC
jgi:hypothetical protein